MSATGPASSDLMAAEQILATARSGARPQGWYVWPLRRDRVWRQALEGAGISAFGFVFLVPLVLVTVPGNFEHGTGEAIATLILLGLFAAVAFGALGLLISDLLRLARADQYLLVMTPTDYVKAVPGRVTHVPMDQVAYVTLRGVKLPSAPAAGGAAPAMPTGIGRMTSFGGLRPYREIRRPPSLAFLDLRTNREVVVATDNSFEELIILHEILNAYAGGRS
jgi:hypothetical protein